MIWLLLSITVLAFSAGSGYAAEYTLDDLYQMALVRSERIKVSDEDVYIAGTTKEKAMSLLLPRVTGSSGYIRNNRTIYSDTGALVQPDEATTWGVRLDQSMSLSGREITALKITKDGIRRSRFDLLAVKESYMFSVAGSYYDYLRSKRAAEIADANVQRLTKHRDAAATRLKVGEVTKTALLRAEAELSGAQSDLVKSMNRQQFAKAYLARVVGISDEFSIRESPQTEVEAVETEPLIGGCGPLSIECLKETAERERPELKSLAIQKRMAEDQIRFTKGAYWPSVSVEGSYSRREESPPTAGIVRENVYGGVRMNFPFFEGGLRIAEVSEAEAKKRQADYAYADVKKSVGIEVDTAYLDYMTQRGVLKSLRDQVTFAKDNYNAVSKQFQFGLANSIDVMDANTLLVTAERQLLDSLFNYHLATIMLKRATGLLMRSIFGSDPGTVSKPLNISLMKKGELAE